MPAPTNKQQFAAFIHAHPLAAQASVAASGQPQVAVIGIVANDNLEIFFDTLTTSRKCQNLRRDPRIALAIGWDDEEAQTVQLEGIADEPVGEELERFKLQYFAAFPEGVQRQSWPDITYFRVRPNWLRYSDFTTDPPNIIELDAKALS
jgi:pyridoxine/pyridoxamine 5'-phosphate oxidase